MMAGVRGWVRTLMWVGILLACAGVGAFIASRSNPFPPGVEDPGARPSTGPSPTVGKATRWRMAMVSRTTHTYRVGGSCSSQWRMRTSIRMAETGRVAGVGVAHLLPGARCDFPTAQVQTARVEIRILGRRDGDVLQLRFRETAVAPPGSQDLGGFVKTLPRFRFSIPGRAGAELSRPERFEDAQGEIYAAVTTVRLSG
jgi:hypothetical protein